MSIIMYLGQNVKEYEEKAKEIIGKAIKEGLIRCDICTLPMYWHLCYVRGIKETGQKLEIVFANCKECKKGHALLPDFILRYKQYSANEIEGVMIDDSLGTPVKQIETEASEPTIRRWVAQIGERIRNAIPKIKYLFMQMRHAISEIYIDAGAAHAELEQLLEKEPKALMCSGNKLGLANIWLGKYGRKAYI